MGDAGDLAQPGAAHEGIVDFDDLARAHPETVDAGEGNLLEILASVDLGTAIGTFDLVARRKWIGNIWTTKGSTATQAKHLTLW